MTFKREQLRQGIMMAVDAVLIALSFLLALALAGREIPDIHYRWYEYLWMITVVVAVVFGFTSTAYALIF